MPRLPELYRTLTLIFAILFVFQIGTGIVLFVVKLGFSPADLRAYYFGDPERFILARSWAGEMESALPHLLAMGTTTFILSHFLIFIPNITRRQKWLWGLGLMLAALLDITAGPLAVTVSPVFVYCKLVGFVAFEVSVFASLLCIFSSSRLSDRRAGRSTRSEPN